MIGSEGVGGGFTVGESNARISIADRPAWLEKATVKNFDRQSGAPVTCLLKDCRIHVPSRTIYSRKVMRLEGSQAVHQLSRVDIPFDPHIRSLVIHSISIFRNGHLKNHANLKDIEIIRREQGLESGVVNGEVSALLLLKDVRIGDVLDVEFSTVDEGSLFAHDVSWIQGVHSSYPVGTWMLVWIDRQDRSLSISGHSDHLEYSEVTADGEMIRTWHGRSIPEHEPEDHLPADVFPASIIQISPFGSWGEIVTKLMEKWNFSERDRMELEEELLSIKQAAGSDRERAVDLAVAAARDAVRYQNYSPGLLAIVPENVSVIWERRFGDCKEKSLLLTWLLREMGIDAEPVLVATSIGRALPDLLPAPTLFDHVVTRVHLGEKILWIDPTDVYRGGRPSSWTSLPFHHGLPLTAGSATLVPIPEPAPSSLLVHETVKGTRGSSATEHTIVFTFRERRADLMRGMLDSQGRAGVRRALKGFMEPTRPGIEIDQDPVCHDDMIGNEMRFEVSATRTEGIKPHPSLNVDHMPISPFSFWGMLPSVDRIKRIHPMAIGNPDEVEHLVRIEHPDMTQADYPLQSVGNPAFKMKVDSYMETGAPVFQFRLEIRKDRVFPPDIPAYRADLEKMFNIADVTIHLPRSRKSPLKERNLEMAWGETSSSGGQGMNSTPAMRSIPTRRRRSRQPAPAPVSPQSRPVPYWFIGVAILMILKVILLVAQSN